MLGDLRLQIPHAVRQAPLTVATGETLLDGADEAGSPGDDQERVPEPAPAHVLEERTAALRVLLRPRHEGQEDLLPLDIDAPRA